MNQFPFTAVYQRAACLYCRDVDMFIIIHSAASHVIRRITRMRVQLLILWIAYRWRMFVISLVLLTAAAIVQGQEVVKPGPPDVCLEGPFHKDVPSPEEEQFHEWPTVLQYKTALNGPSPAFQISIALMLPATYHEQPAYNPLISTQIDLHSWTKTYYNNYCYHRNTL